MPRRSVTVAFGLLIGVVTVATSCSDDTAPNQPLEARFIVAPVFGGAAGTIDLASIRFLLTRAGDGSVARDTVVQITAGQDSVNVELTVPVLTPGEGFFLTLAMVDAAGDTVFRGGPTEVVPTTSGGTPPVVPVVIVYVGTGFDAIGVTILPRDTTTFFGEAVVLIATALDSLGEPIPGTPIVWSTPDSARASVPNADSGRVVGGSARGTARIVAQLLTGQDDTASVLVQPIPNSIAADQGDNQTGTVDSLLGQALVARVLAADGLGVEGVYVFFAVTGGGTLSIDSAKTDSTGRATVTWTLGPAAGPQSVQATTLRLPATSAVFSATALSLRATQLVVVAGDAQTDTVAATLPLALSVQALNAGGLPLPGDTVIFTVTAGGGGGSVSLDTVVTDAAGNSGTTWTLGTAAGIQTVLATLITGADSVSLSATANPGAPSALGFLGQPANTLPNTALPPVTVVASDQFSNLTSTFGGLVDVALISSPNGGTLFGTTSSTAVAGQAAFNDLSIDNIGTAYVLGATSPGLAPATSIAFDILVPPGGVYWVNAAGGNWSVGANWSTGAVPGPLDTVFIQLNGTYTVVADVATTVAVLNVGGSTGTQMLLLPLGGPTLTVTGGGAFTPTTALQVEGGTIDNAGTLSLEGAISWIDGGLTGTGTTQIEIGASLTIGGTAAKSLDAQTLANAGAAQWGGSGPINAANGAALINEATGTFSVDATGSLTGGAAASFLNQGTLTRLGTGTTTFGIAFDNDGTADVTGGTLDLTGGGISTGAFSVSTGATLRFSNGTHDLQAGSSVSGAGNVTFGNLQTVTIGGSYGITGTTTTLGGVADFSSATTSTTTNLTMGGGSLDGTGTLSVTGLFLWTNGVMQGTGTTVVEATGTLNLSTTSTVLLVDRTLQNAGTANWTGTGLIGGAGGTFENLATGTFNAQSSAMWVQNLAGAAPLFINSGVFTRSGSGTSTIAVTFDNGGSVDVQGGTLSLTNGGTSSGSFTAGVGGVLEFAGGTHDLLGVASNVNGPGDVQFSAGATTVGGSYSVTGMTSVTGGTATFNGAATVSVFDLTQSGGTLNGTATLSVASGMTWSGGAQGGSGTTRLEFGSTASFAGGTLTLDTRTIENAGDATFSAGIINGGNGGTFVIEATGTLDISGDVTFDHNFGATSVLNNQGAITRTTTVGDAVIDGLLTNDGSIDIASGRLVLRNAGVQSHLGTFNIQFGAEISFQAGTHSLLPTSNLTGTGTWDVTAGSVTVAGAYTHGGTLALTGGSLTFNSTGLLNILIAAGGNLTIGPGIVTAGSFSTLGSGTLTMTDPAALLAVAGPVSFGGGSTAGLLTAGTIQLDGDFTQTSTTSTSSFSASGTHVTAFVGGFDQLIDFQNASATESRFANLELRGNDEIVTVDTRVHVLGNLLVSDIVSSFMTVDGIGALFVDGDVAVVETATTAELLTDTVSFAGVLSSNGDFNPLLTEFRGTGQTIPVAAINYTYRNVIVSGSATFGGSDTLGSTVVPANLTVPGTLTIGPNTIGVTGSFATTGSGVLIMSDPAAVLNVSGDVTFAGGSTAGLLTNGTLRVGGNFTQTTGIGLGSEFAPTLAHVTEFNAGVLQTVTFADPTASQFGDLTIAQTGTRPGVMLASNIAVHDLFTASGDIVATQKLFGQGNTFSVGGLSVDTVILDSVPIVWADSGAFTGNFVRFYTVDLNNYDSTVTQITVIHNGAPTAFAFTDVQFNTEAVGGPTSYYLRARDNDGILDFLAITLTARNGFQGTPACWDISNLGGQAEDLAVENGASITDAATWCRFS